MKELRIKFEGSGEIIAQIHDYGSGPKLYIGEEDKEVIIVPLESLNDFMDFLYSASKLEVTP